MLKAFKRKSVFQEICLESQGQVFETPSRAEVIMDSLKIDEENIHLFASRFLCLISDFMNIGQSVFYVREKIKDKDCLVAQAGFASYRPDASNLIYELGEGLVGQVAMEGKALHLEDVPEDYITMTSRLGKCAPRSLYIHPMKNMGEVFGVVELASFSSLSESVIELLLALENYLGSICEKNRESGIQ